MNSALAGILSGVAGGANKYGQLKDEQRQFTLSQKAADQAQMRKENFAKFQYSLQDSGMVTKEGRRVSNSQADAAAEGALESSANQQARIKEEARVKALQEAEAKRVSELNEKRKYQEGLTTEADAKKAVLLEAKLKREAEAAKKKETKDAEKAKTKEDKEWVTSSNKDINTKIKDSNYDGVTADVEAAMSFYAENKDNPKVAMIPKVMAASKVYKNAIKFKEIFEGNKGLLTSRDAEIKKTQEQMKKEGMSAMDIQRVTTYLKDTGALK